MVAALPLNPSRSTCQDMTNTTTDTTLAGAPEAHRHVSTPSTPDNTASAATAAAPPMCGVRAAFLRPRPAPAITTAPLPRGPSPFAWGKR